MHDWKAFTPSRLSRPTRAVKGAIGFCDLFGAPVFILAYTLNERLTPGKPVSLFGIGFVYNQFIAEHQWMLGTKLEDMTVRFRIDQILYANGSG